jgi:hypothetical protein
MTTYLLLGTKIIRRKKPMKPGRPKKHRYPYDGYEVLDVNAWFPELVKATRGRPKSIERMTSQEIAALEARVKRARIIARNTEMDRIKAHVAKLAKAHGFKDVKDILR